jgi:outer membrane protein assembly factor BamD (BamD/ComL family)
MSEEKEAPKPRRRWKLYIFLVLLCALTVFLLSNPMMDWYQKRIDTQPKSGFSKWLQLASADACRLTFRRERAIQGYEIFLERYPDDDRRPGVLLVYAESLEACDRDKDARSMYDAFLVQYPEHESRARAESGLRRLNEETDS